MLTLNDGRNELWQWDTGRTLSVDADCSQVHFSNKVFGRSIDVDVIDGVAIIPDILLQTDKELNVWSFVGTPENGYTKISKTFKVNRRNKPSDYVFTPPEQTTLGEILERLDDLESIQDPDAIKNAVEDYLEQNPVESPVQSVNGKTGKVELSAEDVGAISQDDLQEATNEALAQAKESGEFDGEPGKDGAPGLDGQDYVLTEEDKAEIAALAAELVEIPEGSGGGIAVTGAIVGQTVKITAVDDDGVPTAWEPVDMPSGGETWEELANVTLEEESWPIIDIGDYAVNFKKLRFFIALAAMTPGSVTFALSIPNATSGTAYSICQINSFGNESGISNAIIEFEPLIEEGFCRLSYSWAASPATATKASSFSYQYNSYDYARLKTARYFRTNKQLPAGTMIVIKGVRV